MDTLLSTAGIATALGALSSLALAAAACTRRSPGWLAWSFGAGMIGFAAEAAAAGWLLTSTDSPAERAAWLQAARVASYVLLIPWGIFTVTLARPRPVSSRLTLGVTLGSVVVLAGAVAAATGTVFEVSPIPGPFQGARLTPLGQYGTIVQLLATVAILAGLEGTLRTARRETRWRIKYLILGLGAIFLVRFYFLSHVLLFHLWLPVYFTTQSATLLVGNLVVAASLARDRLLELEITISRQILYRSAVVGVLGAYLFIVGVLGWLLDRLGLPETLFWGSLIVFVSALGFATLLLSEDVRWRAKQFLSRNFYGSKYDYRAQWVSFTNRLASLLTLEELVPQLVSSVAEAVGATRAWLYLADAEDGRYRLAGASGGGRAPAVLEPDAPWLRLLGRGGAPALAPAPAASRRPRSGGDAPLAPDAAVAVPLSWQGALTGVLMVGPERTGAQYTAEDLEFLATVGQQAAGALATTRLSETLARSREFEAIHRLTSFVIHDVKNAASALSLLSRNALDHFDDPEFQRDAIRTLSRTVERMQGLLGKLSAQPDVDRLSFVEVDLPRLLEETAATALAGTRATVVRDLRPVPPIAGDPRALERVLQNLMRNALEATDGGGQITLRTETRAGLVACAVADNGCGMSEEFCRRSLFVPFHSTKKGGWGIGLYQAREIVVAHRGRIEVESEEGRGTTFTLLFPPAAADREQGGAPGR